MLEHHVTATDPNSQEERLFGVFERHRWQWAEKMARYLKDKGYQDVEIIDYWDDQRGM